MGWWILQCLLVITTCPEGGPLRPNIYRTQSSCWKLVPFGWLMPSPSSHLQLQGSHWIVQPSEQSGLDSKKEQLGWLLAGLFIGLPSCWLAFFRGQGGNVKGLLLAGAAFANRGWAAFLWFPLGWVKTVTWVGHSLGMWPHPWHLSIGESLSPTNWPCPPSLHQAPWPPWVLPPFLVFTVPCLVGRLWAGVICLGSPLPLWSLGKWGCYYYCIPFCDPFPGATGCTRGAVAMPSLCQGSHELGNLLP